MSTVITDAEALETLAERVKRLLGERGLSLRGLARLTGETPMRISTIVRGLHVPDIACVHRIAEALGVSLNDLLPPSEKSDNAS